MKLYQLNKICFSICIVCIVAGTVLSLAMIWGELEDSRFMWKSWLTIGVFFLASVLTICVNNALGWRQQQSDEE
jgi:uncharacterized membrane protein YhaH (DUF805 family)